MTIEELFGTLQSSVVGTWRKHLRTAKYAKHEALDEFYKEMPEKVDALIEAWMGANGKKVKGFDNLLKSSNMNTLKYLGELKKVCKDGYELMGDNDELKSLLDDIINLINSTLYKVKELSEGMVDLKDYLVENLNVNESIHDITVDDMEWAIQESGSFGIKWQYELKKKLIIDILKENSLLKSIAKLLNITEKDIYDWFKYGDNEDELSYRLNDIY